MLGLLDSVFSVAIFEKIEIKELTDYNRNETFFYLGKPYEYICKEHMSWLERTLKSIKLDTGLGFQIKDITKHSSHAESINSAHYRALRARASRETGKINFKVSYTFKTDNYAQNLKALLKTDNKYAKITTCHICKASEVFIMKNDETSSNPVKVYSKPTADSLALD